MIDTEHRLAELYHIINVPTIVWIDEEGRICRPHDAQFGTDTFAEITGKRSGPYLEMIRAWVKSGEGAMSAQAVHAHRIEPTDDHQRARTHRALAWHLHRTGDDALAEQHFVRAGELAPGDWTIRRGSLWMRGKDPFGPEFFALAGEGIPVYPMDAVTPTRDPDRPGGLSEG